MNKREDGSVLREKELTVMCLKNVKTSIGDLMWCLDFEYVYIKYINDITAIV